MRSIACFRCVMPEPFPGLLMSWIRGIAGLSESLIIGPRILLCHFCGVVLLVEALLLFVEVDQFLVQRLTEQLEILQRISILLSFCKPILSSADEVQRILDFVVAKRLPRVVLEDSALHVSRRIAHLASILLVLRSLPKFLVDLQNLDLLPEKIEITVP